MRILTTLTLLTLLTACGKQNSKQDTKIQTGYNIYGKVDKLATADMKYLSRVGKLFFDAGEGKGYCTASLIGENLILTAAHCIYDSETGALYSNFDFYLGVNGNESFTSSKLLSVWKGSSTPKKDGSYQDWAIAKIEKPLGKIFGYFGIKEVKSHTDNNAYNVALPGYGHLFEEGKVLTVDEGCNIRKVVYSVLLYHDCDMSKGDSGSPLLKCDKNDRCYVVGVNSYERGSVVLDEYDENFHNAAISAAQFKNLVVKLRKTQAYKEPAQTQE